MAAGDPQQQAFYKFQWASVYPFDPSSGSAATRLSLDECRQIVEHAFSEFAQGVAIPEANYSPQNVVRRPRGKGGQARPACYWREAHGITLPDWARSRSIVLHEVAHALTYATAGGAVQSHGPEFATMALELWRSYLPGPDYDAVRDQGVARGIRFATVRPTRRVFHWADGPCLLCGIEPPASAPWRSVSNAPFHSDADREDVLALPAEGNRLRRIFELELERGADNTVLANGLDDLLGQLAAGSLLPDGHALYAHITTVARPRVRYGGQNPEARRRWLRKAISTLAG